MKRLLLTIASAMFLCLSTGCLHHATQPNAGCENGNCGGLIGGMLRGQTRGAIHETAGWRHQRPEIGPAGPPVGTSAYPYYTLRGPRDFLADDPPSIGN